MLSQYLSTNGGKLVNIFIPWRNLVTWNRQTVELFLLQKEKQTNTWKAKKKFTFNKKVAASTSLYCSLAANRWTNKQAESWWCFSIDCTEIFESQHDDDDDDGDIYIMIKCMLSRFAYFVGKIILAGGKIILASGKIILAGGKIGANFTTRQSS